MKVLKDYGKNAKKRESWEAINGKIPDKHVLIHLDGNGKNYQMENLACVSTSVLRVMVKNNLISDDPEITRTGIAIAEHKMAILALVKIAVEENKALMPKKEIPKESTVISCKKCLKIKCKHWLYLPRKKTITCKKYNLPISEVVEIINKQKARSREKGRPKNAPPMSITAFIRKSNEAT